MEIVPTNKTLQDFSSFSTLVSGCSLRCVQPALSPSPSQPALSPPPHLRHLGLSHALLPPPRLHNILFCFQRSSYAVIFHSVQPCQPSMAGAYNMIKFCVVSLPLALFTPSQSLSTLDVSTEKHLHLKWHHSRAPMPASNIKFSYQMCKACHVMSSTT